MQTEIKKDSAFKLYGSMKKLICNIELTSKAYR